MDHMTLIFHPSSINFWNPCDCLKQYSIGVYWHVKQKLQSKILTFHKNKQGILIFHPTHTLERGCCGCDHIVVGFTTTYGICGYRH